MKSFLNGLKKVFGFTVRHRLTKGLEDKRHLLSCCYALRSAQNYVFLGIHSKKRHTKRRHFRRIYSRPNRWKCIRLFRFQYDCKIIP